MTNFFPGTAPFAVLRKPSKAKITRTGILLDMLPPEITCQSRRCHSRASGNPGFLLRSRQDSGCALLRA